MAKRLVVTGRVQGVSYRASFEAQANTLKLAGWVRNRSDGSVEAVVAGEPAMLDSIIEWARQGPPQAVVHQVQVSEAGDDEAGQGFTVRPTI